MKLKTILFALCLTCTAAFAEQKVIVVPCKDGSANVADLEKWLKLGWRVIAATPVTDSDSMAAFGKPKQAFTASIVYVIQKD